MFQFQQFRIFYRKKMKELQIQILKVSENNVIIKFEMTRSSHQKNQMMKSYFLKTFLELKG